MDKDRQDRRKALTQRANALKGHGTVKPFKVLDSHEKLRALEQAVSDWFAGLPAEVGPVERVHCLISLFSGESPVVVEHPLTGFDRTQWYQRILGNPAVLALDPRPDDCWPAPIQYRLDALGEADQPLLGHYKDLFEAFLHLHFAAVASQFLWLTAEHPETPPSDLTLLGLKVLHDTLIDDECAGIAAWLNRGSALSCAGSALVAAGRSAPCGALFDLLAPRYARPNLAFVPGQRGGPRRSSSRARRPRSWRSVRPSATAIRATRTSPPIRSPTSNCLACGH